MFNGTLHEIRQQVTLASDEVVTAEFLATEGVLEWVGGVLEDSQDWAALSVRQWRYLLEDNLQTLEDSFRARSLEDIADLPRVHLQRRMTHLGEGLSASRDLAERSFQRSLEPLRNVWAPFLELIRRDHRS
ncbi:MAG: hypothetical protein JJT88_02560 [Gammaproteobacteria bacterium]|nr:hypothetical protein [Gammaproteobacteria bacterium]